MIRQKLAEIAWNGYSSRNLLVCGDDQDELMKCGLLRSEGTIGGQRNMFSWVHFTIQEYLAADHICSNRFKGDLVKELKRCLKFENRNVFFGFVCGVGGKAVECASEWYPREFELDEWEYLKDAGPVLWIEEGGKKLEDVVAILWEKSFPAFGGHMLKNASMNGCKSVVKFLVDGKKADVAYCGVNVSVCNNFISPEFPDPSIFSGDAPLALAALFGQFEIVKLLIEKDAPLNDCECECGRSALFYASEIGRLEIVNYLIEHGAIIDQDFHGWIHEYWISVLMVASQNGHLEVVKCLIQHGANVNAVDDGGKTALLLASEEGHLEVVKCLIEHGANVNAKDLCGSTPLHLAAEDGDVEIVQSLIEHGVDVNVMDDDGKTALLLAVENGDLRVTKLLLEAEALLISSQHNLNAWHAAKWIGREDIVNLIEGTFGSQSDLHNLLQKRSCCSLNWAQGSVLQPIWKCSSCCTWGICVWCKENRHQSHDLSFISFQEECCSSLKQGNNKPARKN